MSILNNIVRRSELYSIINMRLNSFSDIVVTFYYLCLFLNRLYMHTANVRGNVANNTNKLPPILIWSWRSKNMSTEKAAVPINDATNIAPLPNLKIN